VRVETCEFMGTTRRTRVRRVFVALVLLLGSSAMAAPAMSMVSIRDESSLATRGVTNPIPSRLARVIPGNVKPTTLGRPGSGDAFVTAADDIAGLNPAQLAERLTIPQSRTFTVIEFDTPASGLASPVFRNNPGFVGGGRTAGGAREFVLPNGPIPEDALIRLVGP